MRIGLVPAAGHRLSPRSLLYEVTRKLLSVPPVHLLVLWHENEVLRRQLAGPVRYEPADRFWFAALARSAHPARVRHPLVLPISLSRRVSAVRLPTSSFG